MRIRTRQQVLVLLLLALAALACSQSEGGNPPALTETAAANDTVEAGWYSVYFSQPGSPESLTQRGGPDAALAHAIDHARLSVDAAMFDLNLWSIRDALIDAQQRGLMVRLVTESDNLERNEIQQLLEAGIPLLGDRRQGLMHNKFIVIDRYEVWTGSMNMTLNGAYHNNENLIRIRSPRLAENYLTEFDEMFFDDLFGDASPANTPYPTLTINGTKVEVYFSPDDGVQAQVLRQIDRAQHSVYFLTFSLTSNPLRDALIDAHQRGVAVAGVIESDQSRNEGCDYLPLLQAGVDVRLDSNPNSMHHKVFIIDGQIIVTGSYNYSSSAEGRNDENLIILHNIDIAQLYRQEFDRIFQIAQ